MTIRPTRRIRFAITCAVVAVVPISGWARQDKGAPAAALWARGLELGYNLDYPEALAAFRKAIAADPEDATAYRLAAATIWMHLLFQQGAVTVEDYLGQARANLARQAPPADVALAFRELLDRATALADAKLRHNPADAGAHFDIGAAAGFRASYIATVDGRVLDSVSAARRAYSGHTRCLTLDAGGLELPACRVRVAQRDQRCAVENAVFGLDLSEFHTGYRAFRREVLEAVPFWLNSDHFVFDQEIIAQAVAGGFRIDEVAVPTRYPSEASSASLLQSLRYGMSVAWMLIRYRAHRARLIPQCWLRPAMFMNEPFSNTEDRSQR